MAKNGSEWAARIKGEVQKSIIGQDVVIERLLVALLSNGHVLLEGLPGLAKTLLIKSLGAAMGLEFERIQFTPDLLPSDVVGTMVFQPKEGSFRVHKGPVFANLLLADEINRAPAKVQSALLEAMQERQVTIGGETHQLPRPFLVMATQNPLEQEGTYPLPEAQTDRFLFKLLVDYPSEQGKLRGKTGAGIWAEAKMSVRAKFQGRTGPMALLELKPTTGRTHQLRIQCANRGIPIVGDRTYGDFQKNRDFQNDRLFLHAEEVGLSFGVLKFKSYVAVPENFKHDHSK